MNLKKYLMIVAGVATLFSFLGCGKGEQASTAIPDDGIQTVVVTSNDQMRFNVTEIRATAGEQLRIIHNNIGRMPKQTMGHNWVLFQKMPESELTRLAMEAAQNIPDYLPRDRSVILAKTQVLGPGESETIVFTVPSEPGEYAFACLFPGHFTLMRGYLIVE